MGQNIRNNLDTNSLSYSFFGALYTLYTLPFFNWEENFYSSHCCEGFAVYYKEGFKKTKNCQTFCQLWCYKRIIVIVF